MDQLSRAEDLEQKRIYWKQRIEHWQQTGLSQAEYCRRHNLKDYQLVYWKKRFSEVTSDVSFVSLQYNELASTPSHCEKASLLLTIDNDFKVEINPGFNGKLLQELILVLRGAG